jgi:hypothetical protein
LSSCCRRNVEAGGVFIKVISSIELSTQFVKELRKAEAATKVNAASDSALERPSGVETEVRTSRDTLQLNVSKREAEELSSSDCPSEPAIKGPAPGHLFGDGPEAQGTTGEPDAQSSRQIGPTVDKLAYATVVAGFDSLHQSSGPHNTQPSV